MTDETENQIDEQEPLVEQATAENGPEETSELIELLEQRSATYMFLSRLYRTEIDQEFLDEMHEMLYPADTQDTNLDQGYLYIATYLSNLWDGSLDELKIDYARCFLGHGVDAYGAAYPYESVYTSEKRLLMQDARDEVLALYRKHGMEKSDDWKEGEDHIALELEFEQILNTEAIEAFRCGDEQKAYQLLDEQLTFLQEHLIAWVPMLLADMRKFAQTKMYQGLACLTDGFLNVDLQFLRDLALDSETGDATSDG